MFQVTAEGMVVLLAPGGEWTALSAWHFERGRGRAMYLREKAVVSKGESTRGGGGWQKEEILTEFAIQATCGV